MDKAKFVAIPCEVLRDGAVMAFKDNKLVAWGSLSNIDDGNEFDQLLMAPKTFEQFVDYCKANRLGGLMQ